MQPTSATLVHYTPISREKSKRVSVELRSSPSSTRQLSSEVFKLSVKHRASRRARTGQPQSLAKTRGKGRLLTMKTQMREGGVELQHASDCTSTLGTNARIR